MKFDVSFAVLYALCIEYVKRARYFFAFRRRCLFAVLLLRSFDDDGVGIGDYNCVAAARILPVLQYE